MATVRDIIKRAMRRATVLAAGEDPTADEQADALDTFRSLIDHLSVEGSLLHVTQLRTFNLIAGQRTYTWSSGGDFAATPPRRIVSAWLNEAGGRDIPIHRWEAGDHAQIQLKDTTARPGWYWADPGESAWTIRFSKVPFDPSITFIVEEDLDSTQAISATTGFPKGFDDAFAWKLVCPSQR